MTNNDRAKQAVETTKVTNVFEYFEKRRKDIAMVLPKHITPERLVGVMSYVIKSTPAIMNASQASLISAVIQTVQIGLEPGNLGHCYYVPFNNRKKDGTVVKEVQFILGYKGIIELVNRAGKAVILSTECVYENDIFQHEQGLNPILKHIPCVDGDRGKFRGVYATAKNMIANEKLFVYLTKEDVDKVRGSSKAAGSTFSPWNNWYEEMAKKTAAKRLCKLLPLSIEVQRQVSTDETVKTRFDKDMSMIPDETDWNKPEAIEGKVVSDKQNSLTDGASDDKAQEGSVEGNGSQEASGEPHARDLISEKQGKRLYAISTQAGIKQETLKKYLIAEYGIDSTTKIKREWYENICETAEKRPDQILAYGVVDLNAE